MQLLKLFLAAFLVLDAALVLSTTPVATSSPAQAIGINTGTGSFSLASGASSAQ